MIVYQHFGATKSTFFRKYSLWIIIGIVGLNSVGMSIVLPLLPFLVGKYLPSQQVVLGVSALLSIFSACTFFAAPVLGILSDHYGRRIILLISLSGSVAGYILFGIGGALWILFLSRIIDGLTAGNISTLFAYVADVTKPEERGKWFGYIGAAMGIGKLGGPALGGFLGSIAISLPFYITAALIFLSELAIYFLLPESLTLEKRTKQLAFGSLNAFSHFKTMFRFKKVRQLLIIGVLFYAGLGVFQFNFIVFLKDIFSWGPAYIGTLFTLIGICEISIRGILLPWLLKKSATKGIGTTGLVALAAGLGLIAVSVYHHWIIIIALAIIFIISGEGLFETIYNVSLTQAIAQDKQGILQGVNQSLQSANNIYVPWITASIYLINPAFLYITGMLLVAIAILTYIMWR